MLKDAALISRKMESIKKQKERIIKKGNEILTRAGETRTYQWGLNHFVNHPVSIKLYVMHLYFISFCKRPKQTISIDVDSRQCFEFDTERDAISFKENLARVETNLRRLGFKTKVKPFKHETKPKYRLTISTRENFK